MLFGKRARRFIRRGLDQLGTMTSRYLFDPGGRVEDAIWVVGDGRSGTTWVSNLINYHNSYRLIFEPFHPELVDFARRFTAFQYARPEQCDEHLFEIYRKIFSGRIQHSRTDRYNRNFFYRGRIIKDIFSHLLMKWVDVQFPDVRKILVLRHPFAVAVSKKKLENWKWMIEPKDFLSQTHLTEDFLLPFRNIIESAESYFERQIVIWSIIHYVPLKQLKKGQVHLAFYEELCMKPDREIRRLLSFLGDVQDKSTLDSRLLDQFRKPSPTSRQDSAVNTSQNLIDGWQKNLTKAKISKAVQILSKFGLDEIYGDALMPNCAAAQGMLNKA